MKYLFMFSRTHDVILSEKLLLVRGIDVGVMPVPQYLVSGCGIALRISEDDNTKARHTLYSKGVKFSVAVRSGDSNRYDAEVKL